MTAALFGKLPAHGDFIARGLSPQERKGLDDWLSASLADAREILGERFESMFDQAPPWRFAQQGDNAWLVGAIVPSVDGVGRRFPILAQRQVAGVDQVASGAAHCEARLYDAFEQGWDADALQVAIAGEIGETEDDWPEAEGWWTMGGEDFDPTTLEGERPLLLVRAMLTPREAAA